MALSSQEVTRILESLERGEPQSSDQLLPLVYEELRRIAASKLARESRAQTLQPTALVHEAYVRLVDGADARGWDNRGHFYAAAAEAMRRILIEGARRKETLKRGGGGAQQIPLSEELLSQPESSDELLELDDALRRLELVDREAFQVVMLRYFGGLTVEDAAASLGISPRTVKRNWAFARAWLRREIDRE
jgi:RNA polymerase sigma factor (TIGR02999 family)